MAKLSPLDFVAKWHLRFAPNTTFKIEEADLQEFARDVADSFASPVRVRYLTTAQLTALIGQFEPGLQYVVTDAQPPQLGGDTVPVVVFAQDASKLASYGFVDGSTTGNDDFLVQVYQALNRTAFRFDLVLSATPAELAAVATSLPLRPSQPGSYTLTLNDMGAIVPLVSSQPVTFTVPPGLGLPAPAAGTTGAARVCYLLQYSSGLLTLAAAAGVTLLTPPGAGLKSPGTGGRLVLLWLDTNTVLVEGGVV